VLAILGFTKVSIRAIGYTGAILRAIGYVRNTTGYGRNATEVYFRGIPYT